MLIDNRKIRIKRELSGKGLKKEKRIKLLKDLNKLKLEEISL